MIDLHTHSTASDGTLSPSDLVAKASDAGLSAIALTDHDSVDGIGEAAQEAINCDLTFIPGVEISAEIERGSLHLVGLHIGTLRKKVRKLRF